MNQIGINAAEPDVAAEATAPGTIPNGTFTVSSPSGQHRTFRIRTWRNAKGDPKPRVVELLVGSDNTSDYRGFAFAVHDRVNVWSKHRGTEFAKFAAMLEDLFRGDKSRWKARGMTMDESRTCQRCNRLLTDPVSLARGLGNECAEKMGIL